MSQVRDIIARALAAQGAEAEAVGQDLLEVLAPPEMQSALGLPEFSRFAFGTQCPEGAIRFALESDWTERLSALLGARGRFLAPAQGLGPVPQSPSGPEELLKKHVCLLNATYRFTGVAPAWTRYLLVVLRCAAVSDEQREDLFSLCVNESNGAGANHLATPLLESLRSRSRPQVEIPAAAGLRRPWTAQEIRKWAERCVPAAVRVRLEPFLAGMRRRMSKDLERLHDYHSDLLREAVSRSGERKRADRQDADGRSTMEMRIEAIRREYQAKVADLGRKYAMSARLDLVQGLRVVLPVRRLAFSILRRKAKRDFWLDWNAVSRRLDALPCEGCGAEVQAHAVCDDGQHITCAGCAEACRSCAKAYCRACHPLKCPVCGAQGRDLA